MKRTLLGGASPFVHFAGIGKGGARAEEDRDDQPKGKRSRRAEANDDDKDDEPKGKRSRAEDDKDDEPKGKRSRASDDEEDDEPKGKRSRADDGDDEDEPKGKRSRASDDDDDEDKPSSRRARRARADDEDCDDEDDDKDEMNGRSAAANARRRERARCAAIFGHSAAAKNIDLAASLAFDTTMTRHEAIAVMKRQGGRGGDRAEVGAGRERSNPDLLPGGGGGSAAQGSANLWDATLTKLGIGANK